MTSERRGSEERDGVVGASLDPDVGLNEPDADAVAFLEVSDGDERFVLSQALRQFAATQRVAGRGQEAVTDAAGGAGGEVSGRDVLVDAADALVARMEAAFRVVDEANQADEDVKVGRRSRRRNATAADGPREKTVQIKLTDAEYADVTALAQAMSCSRPRVYTAALASGGAVFARMALIRQSGMMADLYGASRLLAAIGTNLNQLTRAANATGVIEDGIERTLGAVDSVVMRINVILDEADLQ